MAKIVDKNELLEKINDRKWYLNHQLDLYYHFDRTIDRKLLSDREVAFALINVSDIFFRELPKNLRDDEELAGFAISEDMRHMSEVSERLRSNLDFLNKYNIKYYYYSDSLHDDVEVARKAVEKGDFNYGVASKRIREMKEFLPYCKGYYDLPEKYRNDISIVEEVASNDPYGLPEDYWSNKEFILNVLKKAKEKGKFSGKYDSANFISRFEYVIDDLSDELIRNREFIKEVIGYTGRWFSYLPKEYKTDKEIIETAISTHPNAIIFAPEGFLSDNDDLVLEAINNCKKLNKEISPDWLNNHFYNLPKKYFYEEKYALLLKDFGNLYEYMSPKLKKMQSIKDAFGIDEAKFRYVYFWYNGFYTKQETNAIIKALDEKDYDTFMAIKKKKDRGLPDDITVFSDNGYIVDNIDVNKKENFMKITSHDYEAG